MSDKVYRTVFGIVQFPPREGEAGGKSVRNISIRQVGFKDQAQMVSATLWPSHESVEVSEGDVVIVEGPFTQNKSQKQDGTAVTYNNLSVTRIKNFGATFSGTKSDTTASDSPVDDAGDDDIPF